MKRSATKAVTVSINSLFVFLALAFSASVAHAQDGAALYVSKACTACHGVEGRAPTNDEIPIIAGQNKTYLINQITHIRDGVRNSGNAVQMKGIAQTLTDDDIVAISEYLNGLQ